MPIPQQYRSRYVYHFTHVENLPGILEHGILSTKEKERLGIEHTAIAYTDIQERRACMDVPCGRGGVVHDYVPLYFCKRSSMLLAVVNGKIADQQLIIYLEFPITIMNQYPWVLTDASANTSVPPNFYEDESELCKLKWNHIDSLKWGKLPDSVKQARQAELLIHKRIDITAASKIIVWNKSIKDVVLEAFKTAKLTPPPVGYDEFHYYVDFYDSGKHSIVTGPYFIDKAYREAMTDLIPKINDASDPKFDRLSSMLNGLRKNFGCIPETQELIGLRTKNWIHKEDVGMHTLSVVRELYELQDFKTLDDKGKLLVEVAAYLHDIGKGPKERWEEQGGYQELDPNHPLRALPMLHRILTEDVGMIKKSSARAICKLVCYHDLIGDIIGKGRRIEELVNVVQDERELQMLIALGKADMKAIHPAWSNDEKIEAVRQRVIEALESSTPDK